MFDAEYAISVFMKVVIAQFKADVLNDQQAGCHSNG
jgi:hypothetical protein